MNAEPSVKMTVLISTRYSRGSVYTRMYFSRVKSPKAPRPWEKLPTISMMAGASVRMPTIATSISVSQAVFEECTCLLRDEAAAGRIEAEFHLLTRLQLPDGRYPQMQGDLARLQVHFPVLTQEQHVCDGGSYVVLRQAEADPQVTDDFNELHADRHLALLTFAGLDMRFAQQRTDG